jgi:hypothetical protein
VPNRNVTMPHNRAADTVRSRSKRLNSALYYTVSVLNQILGGRDDLR